MLLLASMCVLIGFFQQGDQRRPTHDCVRLQQLRPQEHGHGAHPVHDPSLQRLLPLELELHLGLRDALGPHRFVAFNIDFKGF